MDPDLPRFHQTGLIYNHDFKPIVTQ